MKQPQPFYHREISIVRDGKKYTGAFTVEKGVITVSSVLHGSKSTQLGGSQPEALAHIMLRELIDERPSI